METVEGAAVSLPITELSLDAGDGNELKIREYRQ